MDYKIPNNDMIILEAKSSGKTKYKCQFCSFRGTKEDLVYHVENEHSDMIPQDYTAARTVFNYINKKDHGTCIVCNGETDWREDLWRYERVHPQCKGEYTTYMRSNMKKVYGKENLLQDPEQQEKMLMNRKISGKYKFSDGGIVNYVGSYEKKTLEFLDKVMNVKSTDISAPGPVIEYTHNSEKHFWITDIYFIPMNLVIEVKDGGDNPNTREMTDYRNKQIEKEKAIKKLNKYNYIRLTNNNFEQLLFILAEIKSEMMNIEKEGTPKYIAHINETKNIKLDKLRSINPKKEISKEEKEKRKSLLEKTIKLFETQIRKTNTVRGTGTAMKSVLSENDREKFINGSKNKVVIGEFSFNEYSEKNDIKSTYVSLIKEVLEPINVDIYKSNGQINFIQLKPGKGSFKLSWMTDKDKKIDSILTYATSETAGNSAVGMAMAPGSGAPLLIPYRNPDNNLFNFALKKDNEEEVYVLDDDGNIIKESMEYIQKGNYSVYKYKKPMTMERWGKFTDPKYSEKVLHRTKNFFYEELTGRRLVTLDQLNYDSDFEKIEIGRLFL